MTVPASEKETDFRLPHFIILKASAGSGKTYALTGRFVRFILSENIPRNNLRNILAVTFSNNAAKEMKERILVRLKALCFGDRKSADELSGVPAPDMEKIIKSASRLIDEILDNYSDFQVKTIDSFLTTVFKASAIDFGYNPDFEILMNSDSLIEYAFDRFLRNVREGSAEAELLHEVTERVLEQKKPEAAYPWDPSETVLDEIKKLYRKLSSEAGAPLLEDFSGEIQAVKENILSEVDGLKDMVDSSVLDRNKNSSWASVLRAVENNHFASIIGKELKNPPVNKPGKKQPELIKAYEQITNKWNRIAALCKSYTALHARNFYMPYLKIYGVLINQIEAIKKQQGKIFIGDINRYLAGYLDEQIVPDVYFRLGETIFHFLIDEFQDTSPIQWLNLYPLLENSLSQSGSLFIVGDTKQAIYGFRNADYRIMKKTISKNLFPSAEKLVRELDVNYRSRKNILAFNEHVFKKTAAQSDKYMKACGESGLADYVQKAEDSPGDEGYAEIAILERDDENPPEKRKLYELLEELKNRGFSYKDIAVLTRRNEDAVKVTSWLNEKGIDFISFSSLDVRRRKCFGEIVSLLNFLDSPTDDLSFTAFLLGDVFNLNLSNDSFTVNRKEIREFIFDTGKNRPLYKAFQRKYKDLWERYFAGIFRAAGYLPVYDLISEIYSVFRVFDLLPDEEAAFVKILEAVKEFEGAGYNSLKGFLEIASETDSGEPEWDMDAPVDVPAVKVMTIHKAKGLGFTVVIVLLYESRNSGFEHLFEETEKGGFRIVRLTKDIAKSDPSLQELYEAETMKDTVNQLNSLYVGFTRPKQELYVIGVKGRKSGFPFDLLDAEAFPPSSKPPAQKIRKESPARALKIHHHHKNLNLQPCSDELMNIAEKQTGEFVHRVLYFVEYISEDFEDTLEAIINNVALEPGFGALSDSGFLKGLKTSLPEFLRHEKIAGYFAPTPGRTVLREQEFSDSEGRLYRMDRVVVDSDKVTVIDFKTGANKEAEGKYALQMKTYLRLLGGIYTDKKIEGMIAYLDLKEVSVFK